MKEEGDREMELIISKQLVLPIIYSEWQSDIQVVA